MAISSLGVGSGLDIQGLVGQLVAAEGSAKQLRLDRKETQLQAKIGAMATVKSALSSFQSSYLSLKLASSYSKLNATSTNETLFTASATTKAAIGAHSIQVESLSQAQSLVAAEVADTSAVVGTGTLTIDFGELTAGPTYTPDASRQATINITDGTLNGIKDAINDADIGITASVIYNGSGYQLTLNSESGAANSMRIAVSGDSDGNDTDANGLSMLTYDPTGTQHMTESLAAQDAVAIIDGVTVSSDTDTISGAIEGVTLNLKKAESGTVSTLRISASTATLATQVGSFVDAFNELSTLLKDLTYYDSESKESGMFIGDSVLRGIESRIRGVLNTSVSSFYDPSVTYNSFASVGITTNEDGTLSLDSSKLSTALSSDLDEVRNLFAGGLAGTKDGKLANNLEFGYTPPNISSEYIAIDITAAATHGAYTSGVAAAGPYTMTASDILKLRVDGGLEITIDNIIGAGLSEADIATQLQTAINSALQASSQKSSVTVNFDAVSSQFSITSNEWGSTSSVEITDAQLQYLNLGFAVSAIQSGTNVQGTIGGESATGSGRTLTGTGNLFKDMEVDYIGATATYSDRVKNITGVFSALDDLLDSYLDSDGIIASRSQIFNEQIDTINSDRSTLLTRLSDLEKRYLLKFSTMDALVAQLNTTGTYLENQLKNLPGPKKS
ncbi:MAG: flagellar filament capping protein FliD [Gammaproteobacteria bacterium]|nr:flagellar filament capping protein FliD [Gammaproteobacteria bacterium]